MKTQLVFRRFFKRYSKQKDLQKNIEIILKSNLFDAEWYKNSYYDLKDKKIDFAKHYIEYGAREGRNPSQHFHTRFYVESNLDIANTDINPLVHYILHGKKENRKKWIDFDDQFYARLYPHVVNQGLDPLRHYLNIGRLEGRRAYFDEEWYLEEYPELENLSLSPLEHYITFGHHEGRHPAFDSEWYSSQYQDAKDFDSPLKHYRAKGRREGRHPAFDAVFYMQVNNDLSNSSISPLQHYLQYGRHEGRSPAFSRHWYLQAYREIRDNNIDPYRHFVEYGHREGRPLPDPYARERVNKWGEPNIYYDINVPTYISNNIPSHDERFTPLVSIVVPNYNHEAFLIERLESIYNQTYKNFEVILLDDCSSDASISILNKYSQKYPEKTTCLFNEKNSGSVFRQWKKGLSFAKGELVWIAESDDYCDKDFLENLVKFFRNNAVMLAFSRTDFVQSDKKHRIWSSEDYWAEANLELQTQSFVESAHEIVSKAWGIRNIAPNVSGVLFRHPGHLALFDDPQWLQLRMCGDWIFYLAIIRGGLVAYSSEVTNYYRQHPNNTSINTNETDLYYDEHRITAKYILEYFNVEEKTFNRYEEVLYQHWCIKRGHDKLDNFRQIFKRDDIREIAASRRPNISIASYAFVTGGGETFPILLANLLKVRGYAVTYLNFEKKPTNPGIKSMLMKSIPVLEIEHSNDAGYLLNWMGIEIVHSHHAWIDLILYFSMKNFRNIARVITSHGMYEISEPNQLAQNEYMLRSIDKFVYIADKNLRAFSEDFTDSMSFDKIYNSTFLQETGSVSRKHLKIREKDFVFCLASRAVVEKGWQEAVDAIILANKSSSRKIHLILVGDGPEYERILRSKLPEFIHVLGFQNNVRGYFSISDMGLITSKFKGESCPMVIIECLSVGKPLLTSAIGEAYNMLMTDSGPAGQVYNLEKGRVNVNNLAKYIVDLAQSDTKYKSMCGRVDKAFEKFNPNLMIEKYEHVYNQALKIRQSKPHTRIRLSVILVAYNMARELPRTLHSLSADFQKMNGEEYEIIVIDNGSTCSYDLSNLHKICPNLLFSVFREKKISPVSALNYGISIARGEVICAFIDAARMASPKLLRMGLQACRQGPRVVAGSLSYHIGHEPQNQSVIHGYNQHTEDALLQSVSWMEDGYELFNICSFDPSSRFGLYSCPAETNSLFMSREMWNECGGFDECFTGRGGGLANLDLWKRLCDCQNNTIIMLLGEGTFHQFHGGAATNSLVDTWSEFHEEYIEIRGEEYCVPNRTPLQLGNIDRRVSSFALRQFVK